MSLTTRRRSDPTDIEMSTLDADECRPGAEFEPVWTKRASHFV